MRKYNFENKEIIVTTTFSTPLGEMFAAASKKGKIIFTYFVPFHIEAKIEVLKNSLNADVIPGNCEIFELLKIQLEEYFNKQRTTFEIPLQLIGTSFLVKCWKELLKIPEGKSLKCEDPTMINATLQNMIEILVPSHRVIFENKKFLQKEENKFLLKLEQNDQ